MTFLKDIIKRKRGKWCVTYDFQSFTSLYNTIAILLGKLKQISSEYFYRVSNLDGLHLPVDAKKEIAQFTSKICDYAERYGLEPSYMLVHYGLPAELVEWMAKEWIFKDSFKAIHEMIDNLTKSIKMEHLSNYVQRLDPGFTALNSNTSETGFLVLPRFSAINERIEAGESDRVVDTRKNNEFTWAEDRLHIKYPHIYYVEIEKLTTNTGRVFRVKNYIIEKMDGEKTPLDKLVIASSPLSYSDALSVQNDFVKDNVAGGNQQSLFRVDGIKDTDRIHSRIEAAFVAACRSKADILLFPEMLGDKVTHSEEYWEKLYGKADQAHLQLPKMVFAPTWWYDQKNELIAIDNGTEQLFTQQKQYPFDYEIEEGNPDSNITEDLKESENTIHIVHYPGVGRLILPICKDFLINSYRDILLRELGATLLLIPSFSFGSTQFNLSMLEAMQYGCYEIWLNSCAAFWNKPLPHQIGAIATPFVNAEQPYLTKLVPQCKMCCGGDDDSCLFLITISLGEDRSISYNHLFSSQ